MRYALMILPMLLAVFYAEGVSFWMLNNGHTPSFDPLVFGVMGGMVVSVMLSFGMLVGRIRELEKKIDDMARKPN